MKEIVNLQSKAKLSKIELGTAILSHTGMAVLGFIASRAAVLSAVLPFGLSFVAGADLTYLPSVAIGVFSGYFFPALGIGGFRYIAAMLAIFAIRLMLSGYKKISESPIFLSLITTLACGITGAVALGGLSASVMRFLAECILAGGGAFFVGRVSRALKQSPSLLSSDELCCLIIVISILLMGTHEMSVYGVGLTHVLSVLLILAAAKYGGVLSGAVSGIAVSVASALCMGDTQSYIMFAFGGITAGIFAPYGRFAQILSLFCSGVLGISVSGFNYSSAALIVEMIIGITLFLLIPKGVSVELGKNLSSAHKSPSTEGIKKSLNIRMNMAAAALADVTQTVEQVSGQLAKINAPDFESVFTGVEREGCVGCKLRVHCWETRRDKTVEAILAMTKGTQNSGEEGAKIPEEFRGRCIKFRSLQEITLKKYSEYTSKLSAENRIREIRDVVADQFAGISDMLCDLARDFELDEQFDNATAQRICAALKSINIRATECSCKIDRFGRMTVELKVKKEPDLTLNKLQLMKVASVAGERDFGVPATTFVGGEIYITLTEHANFSVDIGISQQSANDNNMCGDAYSCFNDGAGHYVAILSDGMGTGGRAAVDSAMATGLMTRLLKAGFGYDCSLRMLNSSMLFKSSDESLATVDIASVDLFTGEVELCKAGAPPTVIRRSGKTGRAESSSLPIGILQNVGFDKASLRLKGNDILLMISDGAMGAGIDWIRTELESFSNGRAQDLADHIVNCARRRRDDDHEDDITAIAIILEKNP